MDTCEEGLIFPKENYEIQRIFDGRSIDFALESDVREMSSMGTQIFLFRGYKPFTRYITVPKSFADIIELGDTLTYPTINGRDVPMSASIDAIRYTESDEVQFGISFRYNRVDRPEFMM